MYDTGSAGRPHLTLSLGNTGLRSYTIASTKRQGNAEKAPVWRCIYLCECVRETGSSHPAPNLGRPSYPGRPLYGDCPDPQVARSPQGCLGPVGRGALGGQREQVVLNVDFIIIQANEASRVSGRHSSQEEGMSLTLQGLTGKQQGQSGGRGSQGNRGQQPLLWFPWQQSASGLRTGQSE